MLLTRIVTIAIALCVSLPPARAESPRGVALIVGNATYTTLPALPGCARSANVVSAALRALSFEVIDRPDATSGAIDAGIGEFSQRLADGKTPGVVYICGYATDFNSRVFLLPATARIERPSDLMTQGVLAKSLLAAVTRDPATTAVVVFDLIPKPDGTAKLDLDALAGVAVPDGVGIVAGTETTQADAPTPLATALAVALAGPTVHTEALVTRVQTQLAGSQLTLVAARVPVRPGFLAGAPAPVEPKAAAAAPMPASTAPEQLPDEAQMTEFDRRKVQGALVRLGYYSIPVDGVFGPETRAAIRRYQHEIGADMTGRLTGAQATKLVGTR